jgi:predicted lipoprotein
MRRLFLTTALCALPFATRAQPDAPDAAVIADVVQQHIVPRFETLAERTAQLAQAAQDDCAPGSATLRAAYSAAFDAWISASHLRFGPTETDDRAFALAFWPDNRGATPRALAALVSARDPVAASAHGYAQVSIAARGFYALEFVLFDATLSPPDAAAYTCTLVQTMTADIAQTSAAIATDWQSGYAQHLLQPDADSPYRSGPEVLQELLKALTTDLQFTSEMRLGRPLGTFEQPRPTRAENWRSGRSARNVVLSLMALRDLAGRLAHGNAPLAADLDARFDTALTGLEDLDDPVFAGVSDPQHRLKLEVIQQSVDGMRVQVRDVLGPALGVAAGFNALDGD